MGSLHTIVSAMHLFDKNPNSTDIKDLARQCIDLIAKFPTIVAYNYHASAGHRKELSELPEPRDDYSHAENFLYMLHHEFTVGNCKIDTILHFLHVLSGLLSLQR